VIFGHEWNLVFNYTCNFVFVLHSSPLSQVCVSKCPSKNQDGMSLDAKDMVCKPDVAQPKSGVSNH
jgi:hypothetical protein